MNGNDLAKSFYLQRKFEELNMKQNEANSFISRLLSIYNYHSPINRRIIFHSFSQSWILALTKQLKNKLLSEGNLEFNLISFEEIFLFFISTKVQLNYFYENMKKCIYRTNHTTLSLMEFKFSQVFIEKIEENKKKITIIGDIYPQTKKDFGEIMMKVIVITVNYTLNEIDSQEENKSNLFLYSTFSSIFNQDMNKSYRYQLFMNQIIKEKENKKKSNLIDINSSISLSKVQNHTIYSIRLAKLFYALANTNYADLLSDVKHFIFTHSTWNQKIGIIIKNMVNNKQNVLFRFTYFTIKNFINAIYTQMKSISISPLIHVSLDSKKNKSQMSLTKVKSTAECSDQNIMSSIIDWNIRKLNDIKNISCSILYTFLISTIKFPSFSDKSNTNQNMTKKSVCERCSCLYLSHFSFEYESSGSRTNSVISEI